MQRPHKDKHFVCEKRRHASFEPFSLAKNTFLVNGKHLFRTRKMKRFLGEGFLGVFFCCLGKKLTFNNSTKPTRKTIKTCRV